MGSMGSSSIREVASQNPLTLRLIRAASSEASPWHSGPGHSGLSTRISRTLLLQDTRPFGKRSSKLETHTPPPQARFGVGVSVDPSTSGESSWNRGQFVEEDTNRLSGSGPHRTPGSGAKAAGRQPHRPSRSRPSLPGQGSKRQSLASQRSDPISALPAGLLGPPDPGRDAHFTPSPELGRLAISAQLGNRDAVQTPPLAPLESSSAGASLLLT